MNKKEILARVKELDESGTYSYLYMGLGNGSAKAEEWLDELEERNITSEQELIANLADMGLI
jgi:hypothetical protein